MNWVDVLAVILLIRMGYIGYSVGLFSELVKFTGVVTGFFLSFRYYQGLGDLISSRSGFSIEWGAAAAMLLLVLVGYWAVTRALQLLEKMMKVDFLTQVSQVGGLVMGLVRAGLITSVVLVLCRQLPSQYLAESIDQRSLLGPTISRMAPAVYDAISPFASGVARGLRASAP